MQHMSTSIYSKLARGARSVHAALPRMHLLFNVLRAFVFLAILAWSLIVLAVAVHFQLILVPSELTRFIPLALFAGSLTFVVIGALLVLSNLRKTNPVSTRIELSCLAILGTVWLALGLLMATSPSQDADVECFSDIDHSLEVTSFTTDTFHAQYRVIEAFSLFNAILTWGYFLTLLVLALRHHHLGWKRVWSTPATSSPFYDTQRRGSHKHAHHSESLPVPVTSRLMAAVAASHGHRTPQVAAQPTHRETARRQSPRHLPRPPGAPRAQSPRPLAPRQQADGKKYVVYVPEVRDPPQAHPRTHHRHRTTSPRRR